ncbi:PfkB family carbohydrate kinase [Alkalisalibacterium limincola]|uniref:PfkB family carbohydrate kinase n=1 Tax=Alkalisalibacterium limincola TaxID=2699169 RepID=UPI002AA2A58E|nr:PfkB family carbohydrate kinase [Alkalisalibacterium limincola]
MARALAAENQLVLEIESVPAQPSGTAAVLVDAAGRNLIVVALGANLHLTPAFITDAIGGHAGARVLLAQLESPAGAIRHALEHGRERGLFTVLNPAPVDAQVDAAMLQACELITPNESEFSALMHRFDGLEVAPEAVAGLDDEALALACAVLPCPRVLVTLGAGGCVLVDSGQVTRFAAEAVDCIDSTGAGDAFNGALCARLSEGAPLDDAIVFAGRYAGLSTERRGAALAMPTAADLARRFG